MSAIIGGLLPKIEGFQPIPNAVMIPFMEAQSAALAYGFGLNYEYGKRKVRSMSNKEFNSLTPEQITNMSNAHTHIILSKFQAQVPAVMPMQTEIFKQYVIIEKAKVAQNFELAKWMVGFIKDAVAETGVALNDEIAHLFGTHLHTSTTPTTPVSPNDPSIPPSFDNPPATNKPPKTDLTPAQASILRKQFEKNISDLKKKVKQMEQENISFRKTHWDGKKNIIIITNIPKYNSNLKNIITANTEIGKQQGYLANVNNGKNPY